MSLGLTGTWHSDGWIWQLSLNTDQHFWMPESLGLFKQRTISWTHEPFVEEIFCQPAWKSLPVKLLERNITQLLMWERTSDTSAFFLWVIEKLSVRQINGHFQSNFSPYLQRSYQSSQLHCKLFHILGFQSRIYFFKKITLWWTKCLYLLMTINGQSAFFNWTHKSSVLMILCHNDLLFNLFIDLLKVNFILFSSWLII